jgi:hypothetical protein
MWQRFGARTVIGAPLEHQNISYGFRPGGCVATGEQRHFWLVCARWLCCARRGMLRPRMRVRIYFRAVLEASEAEGGGAVVSPRTD